MAAAIFTVTPELLRQTASQCEAQRARYHSIYTKVLGEANTLNPFFKGRAHDAFVRRLQAFENDFRLMEELLFKYVTYLKESARKYDVIDETIAAEANKLSSRSNVPTVSIMQLPINIVPGPDKTFGGDGDMIKLASDTSGLRTDLFK